MLWYFNVEPFPDYLTEMGVYRIFTGCKEVGEKSFAEKRTFDWSQKVREHIEGPRCLLDFGLNQWVCSQRWGRSTADTLPRLFKPRSECCQCRPRSELKRDVLNTYNRSKPGYGQSPGTGRRPIKRSALLELFAGPAPC